jgi:aldehyde:ferredoxin oxidoreductase
MQRIGFVDLTTGAVREEPLEEALGRSFIGGYGLGVRVLFERQRPRVDPLGPENTLGFATGPLIGTRTPTGGRYMVVCKSPLTGGWGDANAGGYFGSTLKAAGWDALFVSGCAPRPQYLLVTERKIELREAQHLWGKDTFETEDALREELGCPTGRVASIGPASEKLSLISGIMNDHGRAAGRSGVGAVMGAKRLKAVFVHGEAKVPIHDPALLLQLQKTFVQEIHEIKGTMTSLMNYGTCGGTSSLVLSGASPIKNWQEAGPQAFPSFQKIADADEVIKYQQRKYACANCPIACGGLLKVSEGPYPFEQVKKPEYETIGGFGTLCLNDDLPTIIKLNDMCNRSGLDTISAGSVLAFAMECYEQGIVSQRDLDGIDLRWGNGEAMIALLDKIIRREGVGDFLADGVKVAAAKIGRGAEAYAIHVGGQEPGLHSPLFLPHRGMGFVCDPTPGRHTAASPMARIDTGSVNLAPYPELQFRNFERYEYQSKGPATATASSYYHVGSSAGACLMPVLFSGNFRLLDFLNAVTGWNMDIPEALETGARIQTLRQLFNFREGINPTAITLPPRLAGLPPKKEGPVAGVTIDIATMSREYWKAMGWNPETGVPTDTTIKRLELAELVREHG